MVRSQRGMNRLQKVWVVIFVTSHLSLISARKTRSTGIGKISTNKNTNVPDTSIQRKLPKHPKPHHHHTPGDPWKSCLNYTCSELGALWHFHRVMPRCPGYPHECTSDELNGLISTGDSDNDGSNENDGAGDDIGGSGSSDNNDHDNNGSTGGSGGGDDDSSYDTSGHDGGGDNGNGNNSGGNNGGNGGGNGNGGNNGDNGNGNNSGGNNGSNGGGNGNGDNNGGNGGGNENGNNGGNNGNNGGGDGNNGSDSNDGDNSDPSKSFDLSDCSTYQNFWVWDLAITCESNDNLENCQCATAETMMEQGLLSCPDGSDENPYCPSDCHICHKCLAMLGCEEIVQPGSPYQGGRKGNFMPFMLAGLAGILLGILAMWVQKENRSPENDIDSDMDANLLDSSDGEDNVWLAPMT